MALLGEAAVAMWWDIVPERREEFGDWHSHEHFPERMSIPGFRRGTRWTSTREETGFFVLYELEKYETLTSSGYLDRLNAPTPWSTKMMPHHLNMVRSQCRIAATFGGGIATSLTTIRLSPEREKEDQLQQAVIATISDMATRPGLTGAHLLITDIPKTTELTTEQRIRGADRAAAWIILLSGYDSDRVQEASDRAESAFEAAGAHERAIVGLYRLGYAMTQSDLHR
jgi:hypothetical protein